MIFFPPKSSLCFITLPVVAAGNPWVPLGGQKFCHSSGEALSFFSEGSDVIQAKSSTGNEPIAMGSALIF